jgi:arylsulfatase A-like enzyme
MRLIVLLLAAIAAGGLAITGILFGATQPGDAQVTEHPNIVFVMTDDLDEQPMQQLSGIRNIMGSNGTTFNNAYVTYSLCCPSRATILRGQYPHNHQIIGNSSPQGGEGKFRSLGLDKSTVATWLNSAGYQTKYIGKYMNGYGGSYVPPGWDEWFVLKGDPTDGRINQDGQEIALSGHSTDVFAGQASDFIQRSATNSAPFFVTVGTFAPHDPPPVADRYKSFFANTALPRPPNFDEENVSDKPQYIKSYPPLTDTQISSMQSLYRQRLRSMLSVEDLLRQVIGTLRDTGELSNTYIFFTSDNGYHLGNHRVYPGGKRLPYEEDIGVPLMVRGPGVPAGAVRDQLVMNTDFAPTMADLAGVSTPAFVDGSSVAPLLTDSPPSTWRQAFLEEGWLDPGTGAPKVPTHKGVHTQNHMFVEYDTGERELYDLNADPYQLLSMPQDGNEQLYSELGARLNNLKDCAGDACRAAEWTLSSLPETTIDSGPSGQVDTNSASFTFSASVPGATFKCSLDGEAFSECVSPQEYAGLTDGIHSFRVMATDATGSAEPTPAMRTWTVGTQPSPSCTITGTANAETISGTSADDVICAGGGNDTIKGLGGNDTLMGEGGADTLLGGVGNDTIDGGLGTDTASYSASLTAVNASLATNSATGEGSDTFTGIENLLGSSKADTLTGSDTNNKLTGGVGPDTEQGGSGDDTVIGSGGADTLKGEGGNDTVNSQDGVSGNDTLDGGFGTDTKVTDATEKSIVGFP